MRDLAYIAVFAALIIVFAFVSIPVGTAGVPIVIQNAVVILTGLVLGARRGFLATLLFMGLGLFGLPVLAGGRSTLSAISGPTVGYMVGYIIAALVAGLIAYTAPRSKGAMTGVLAIAALVGLFIQYAGGTLGLMLRAKMDLAAAAAVNVPFLVPDLIKLAFMVLIAVGVHTAFPDLMGRKARAPKSQAVNA